MDRRGEARPALAAACALAGMGGVSGRAAAGFFGQLGDLSWAGIAAASVFYGLLMAGLWRAARDCGATSLPALFRRRLGRRWGRLAARLHGLVAAGVSTVMLARAWRLGALMLPLAHGGLWGCSLAAALALGVAGFPGGLPLAGGAALGGGTALLAALALDPRPARVYARAETLLALEGAPVLALSLAIPYAALAATLGAAPALSCAGSLARPRRFGALCGLCMGASLCAANLALWRGGRQLLGQAEPMVLLAARWGKAGFWLQAGGAFLSAAATLGAALAGLAPGRRREL